MRAFVRAVPQADGTCVCVSVRVCFKCVRANVHASVRWHTLPLPYAQTQQLGQGGERQK